MSEIETKSVREGISQANFNQNNAGILIGEIFLISIGVGWYYKSWWAFGGTLFGLMIAFLIKPIAILLTIVLSLGWGGIGYVIGTFFNSQPASIVLGIIGFVAGVGLHISAVQWVKDI